MPAKYTHATLSKGIRRITRLATFVKISDIGKLKYGSKLFNVTADRTIPGGVATIGYDDDGVKTTEFPIVRDGILVGLQTNRESAHFIGERASRGCPPGRRRRKRSLPTRRTAS